MSDAPLKPGRIVAGRYRIEQQIGEGGMGAVYLVRHVRTDEMLALKVLHADVLKDATAVERFRREARAPAKIASEHIARVTDADTAADLDNAPFYVMEYLRGRDLDRTLAEDGPLPANLVVDYLRQTARALDKAHQMGIIHRDLKPENLFLTHRDDGSPCIKLLDFGIARLGDTGAVNPLKTQAGYIFGTPAFMSPEQALGDIALIGPATDVWALGLVAFKLLMARDFWGEHPTARLCAMILTGPIPTPTERGSSFGPGFDSWFAKCVARPVDERFRTAGEAVARLADALGVRLNEGPTRASNRPSAPPMSEAITGQLMTPQSFAPTQVAHDQTGSAQIPMPPPKQSSAGVVIAIVGIVLFFAAAAIALLYVTHGKSAASAELTSTKPMALADAGNAIDVSSLSVPPIDSAADSASAVASADGAHAGVAKAAPSATTTVSAKPTASPPAAKTDTANLTRDQKHRLESLQRMCDQGTFTPAECQAKRAQISQGP